MRQKLSCIMLAVLSLMLLMVPAINRSAATPLTKIFVDPPETRDPAIGVGSNFSIEVKVEYVTDLYGWSCNLTFRPNVVQILSLTFSTWMADASGWTALPLQTIDNAGGWAAIGQVLHPLATSGATGDGSLVTVTFNVTSIGATYLDLTSSKLNTKIHNNNVPIEHVTEHGLFDNRGGKIEPVAIFSVDPPVADVGDTIEFDASASYDPDGTIISYSWNFGDGETFEEIDPETTHAYTTTGTYTVALTVTDNDGLTDTAIEIVMIMVVVRDVAVIFVEAYPTQVRSGQSVQVNVIVRNEGAVSETFDVAVYYDASLIDIETVWDLPSGGYEYVWFEWNTAGVSEGTYAISAEASIVPGETDVADNTYVDGVVTVIVPSITVSPEGGPMGTMVRVEGSGFPVGSMGYIMFDDELVGFVFPDMNGDFNATFNVPLSEAGQHVVKAIIPFYPFPLAVEETFIVIDTTPLDVDVDVGAIYFKGETAEFYVQTSFKGLPVDATSIHAILHKPDGTEEPLTVQRIALGVYKLEYAIRGKSSMLGTYTLIVNATYSSAPINSIGTALKTFVVKSPWSEWERDTRNVALSVATIVAAVGLVFLWRRENKKLQI